MNTLMEKAPSQPVNEIRGTLAKAGTNRVDFVEFYIGKLSFGVNILKVKQLFQYDPKEVTRLDHAMPEILGTIYFRGKPVLLIDLAAAIGQQLQLPSDETVDVQGQPGMAPNRTRIVLTTEFNGTITGFLIDGVNRIHRESWDKFQPVEGIISRQACVTGNITVEGRIIQIVDLEELLTRISPATSLTSVPEDVAELQPIEARKRVKVLYLEDSNTVRKATTQRLRGAGFENLTVFENGLAASKYLEQLREQIKNGKQVEDLLSVVVTDIEMPQLDGLTFCGQIKSDPLLKNIPVLIYSSLATQQIHMRCEEVGADEHLSKPKINEIALAIDRLTHARLAA